MNEPRRPSLWERVTRPLKRTPAPSQGVTSEDVREALEAGRELGYLQAFSEQWQTYTGFDTGREDTLATHGVRERDAYEHHSLFSAATQTLLSLVVGDGITYGVMDDATAYAALEEWYALNELATYSVDITKAWLLDGELLLLQATNAPRNAPAWVNLWDTRRNGVSIETEDGNPRRITSVTVNARRVTPDGFAWRANDTTYNDVRGRSSLRTAVDPAHDYTRLRKYRMRAHDIRARLNAVYYAMAKSDKELEAKAARYRNLPKDGRVLTVMMNPENGQSEKLEFTNVRTDAADAQSDVRNLVREVAMVFGIPEHYLAIGDTANLATAQAMSEPMIRRVEAHQELIRGVLNELFRKELVRRYGPDRLYTLRRRKLVNGRYEVETLRVTAQDLEIPLNFPPVRDSGATDLARIQYAHSESLISDETATEQLGFDPALEAERLANDEDEQPDEQPAPPAPDEDEDEGTEEEQE